VSTKLAFAFVCSATAALAQVVVAPTATPNPIAFTYQIGSALPANQTVAVKGGPAVATYTTAVNPPTALWVAATPDTGKMPANLVVRVNPTGLAEGAYSADIDVTITGVATPIAITVNLSVTAPLPKLTVAPRTVDLAASVSTVQGTIALTTTATPVSFTASVSGAPWLTLTSSSASGVVLPGGPFTMTFTADPSTLTPQAKAYTGKIVVVANGVLAANKTQNVTVNFTVSSSPPTITSLSPGAVQANVGPATIWIRGANFFAATTVKAGATSLTPTVISSDLIQVVVPALMLTVPGTTLTVTATNPPPGGGDSVPPGTLIVSAAPVIQAVLNAASYVGATVSPGEIVELFGLGIGPTNPIFLSTTMNPGFVDTSVGGLTVSIGGHAAPLLYADANQVTVQVPYEVIPGPNQTITVTNGTTLSVGPTITIGAIAPGVFTADGSGIGQAAAIVYNVANPNGGLNSTANAAHAGDTIALYLTGEGDYLTTPVQHTGYIVPLASIPPLPQIPVPPTVTIGGVAATVNYAGVIPGCMIGLLQINVVVPAGLPAGAAKVVVSFGATQSQDKVTIAVK
jgi:uncharacterized protein (TIGR03437 family)